MVDDLLSWIRDLPPLAFYSVLALLSATENVFPPVPADIAVVLGAFLSRAGSSSAVVVGVSCWLANTLSAGAVYFLARSQGRGFLERDWPRRLLPAESMRLLKGAYERHGMLGIFFSRFLPGVRAAVMPFAGIFGVSPLRALIPAALASAIWYGLLILAGTTLGDNWDRVKATVEGVNRWLAVSSIVLFCSVIAWLRWRRTSA